jgi:hypothetical protein
MGLISILLVAFLFDASRSVQTLSGVDGVVRDARGDALPGTTVTVKDGSLTRAKAVSDEGGAFELVGLASGTYAVTASLAGFRPQTKTVRLGGSAVARLDFTLRARPLEEVLWVVPEPREGYRRADAIAHLRVDGTAPPGPCGDASVVEAVHDARVVDVWKGALPPAIRLVQEAAGVCFDGSERVEGIETTYQPGDEYVVFLARSDDGYKRLGGPGLTFGVQGGRILTHEFANLPETVTLEEFRTALERLAR